MANHTYFKNVYNGFYSDKPNSLFYPYNTEEFMKPMSYNDEGLTDTLYNMAISKADRKDICCIAGLEKAIMRIMYANKGNLINFGGYAYDSKGNFWADYYDNSANDFNAKITTGDLDFSNSAHILLRIDTNGFLSGACINEEGSWKKYTIQTAKNQKDTHSSSAACYALMAKMYADFKNYQTSNANVMSSVLKIFGCTLEMALNYFIKDEKEPMIRNLIRATDVNFYTLFIYPDNLRILMGGLPFEPDNYKEPDVNLLKKSDLNDVEFVDIVGNSKFISNAAKKTKRKKNTVMNVQDYVDKKSFFVWDSMTSEQAMLLPTVEESIPDEAVLTTAAEIKATVNSKYRCKNVLFYGESGCGKSYGSQQLARLLNLPYYSQNLSGDKMTNDLFVNCLPNANKVTETKYFQVTKDFPSADEVSLFPDVAYQKVTGAFKPDATAEDVYKAEDLVRLSLLKQMGDFMYADSSLMTAIRNGGIIELQEFNASKPAIIKALNEVMDDGTGCVHLPTGEVVKRHPNCIIVCTCNTSQGYQGINAISNDMLARFNIAQVFAIPDDEELVSRTLQRSGFGDKDVIKKMVKVMKAMQRVLLDNKGDCGNISPRQLYNWARMTNNCNDAYKAAMATMVNLEVDEEIRVELIHALETEFAPKIQ